MLSKVDNWFGRNEDNHTFIEKDVHQSKLDGVAPLVTNHPHASSTPLQNQPLSKSKIYIAVTCESTNWWKLFVKF